MTYKAKRAIAKTAAAGARGVLGVLRAFLKALGIFLLILITTGAIFACIFVLYIKTNLASSDLGVTFEEYQLNETSIIYYYDKISDSWVESTSIQSSEGYRYWVPYDEIPKYMEQALVAIEDKRFYIHHGVDWGRTAQAFVYMFLGMKNTFGGSTITQQLRKNITGENDETVRRKLTEIFAALQLEKQYDKWQIIEWYLNVVNFGHGKSQGIGDAARYYFDKEVRDLTLAESACIIGITNNPSMYNPYYHPEANKRRQETILYQMLDQGYIDEATYEAAKAEHLNFVYNSTSAPDNSIYSWFDEVVREDAAKFLAEQRGISVDVAYTLLETGGFKIYSTMDPEIQSVVDSVYGNTDVINSIGISGSSQQIQSSIVVMDPYNGDIVALAGAVGKKEGNLLYNMATDAQRSPGSSFKPISAYAPAMDFGYLTPQTLYEDSPSVKLQHTDWLPVNSDYYHGIVSVRYAIQESINVVAAQVVDQLTVDVSYDFLTNKLHMNLVPEDKGYAALALGQLNYGITVREMANAFSIFPNSGIFVPSRTFSQIYDSDWNLLYENTPAAEAVISDTTAYWMTDMLHNAAVNGTGYEANLGSLMPTAGKTGTTTSYRDRWFVGFTPYYLAAVWTGYPYPATIYADGQNPSSVMWKKVMSQVHQDLPYKEFSVPANTYQEPVKGVEQVSYTARCVTTDVSGGLGFLYEETGTGVVGKSVTVKAPTVEGYELVGDPTQTITLTAEPEDNVALFNYTPIPQEPPAPPDEPTPPEGGDDTPPPEDGGDTTPPEGGNTPPPEDGGDTDTPTIEG